MDNDWLRDAIRISFNTTKLAIANDGDGPPEQRDPRLRKLVEGLLYSRQFILSYHLVLFVVITLCATIHWTGKALRWRNKRATRRRILAADNAYSREAGIAEVVKPILKPGQSFGETSSSGSSTLGGSGSGIASPPAKVVDPSESSPLLHDGHILRPPYPRRTIISRVQAFLMYQPQPIPFINKTLPSNRTSILILAFIGLNVFYTLYHIHLNLFELFVFADRFGLVFVANLPLLYLLAAKTQPLKVLTGWSYESLNIFHRRLGELLCFEALVHGIGMTGVWYTLLRPRVTLLQFLLNRVIILGLCALLAYETLYFSSLSTFRQRWYELFLGLHIFLQVIALVFVYFHHPGGRVYVGTALAIFFVDRLLYRVGVKSTTVLAKASVFEDGETVKLSTTITRHSPTLFTRLFGRSICEGWEATDHVFISVPCLARKHIIQAHPFTIASAAPTPEEEEARLDLIIRAHDGFSADLLKKAVDHSSLSVRIDGPYGSSHAREMLEDSDLAVVIAGGSGIAVAWPLVQHLLDVSRSTDTEILPTCLLRRQKVVLIWVVHSTLHLSWLDGREVADAEDKGVDIIIPEATDDFGRPDLDMAISRLVDEAGDRKKIRVVASGPDSMGRGVRNTCARLRNDGRNIDVSIEKFGW